MATMNNEETPLFSQHELILLDLSVMERLAHAREVYELRKNTEQITGEHLSKGDEKLIQQNIDNLEALHQKLLSMIGMDSLKEPESETETTQ